MLRPLPDDVIDDLVVQALKEPGGAQDKIRALVRLVEWEHIMRLKRREKPASVMASTAV